jgi:site-specific recombinase XerD
MMSSLRQQMTELMVLNGFAVNTQKSYLYHITQLANYFHRSPDKIDEAHLREYLLYCHQGKQWSYSSCRQFIHAARFMFDRVLERPISKGTLPFPKREEKIPELLSRAEVSRIIECCPDLKYQTQLKLAYGTGMRAEEIVKLMIRHLDGERNVIRINQGKGKKDREIDFTDGAKTVLRTYWREYHPISWLFYSRTPQTAMAKSTLQKAYTVAKLKAEVHKVGGIHGLRHAYATHQLENGMPLPQLQHQLGHAQVSTTLRYTRWIKCQFNDKGDTFDLLKNNQLL